MSPPLPAPTAAALGGGGASGAGASSSSALLYLRKLVYDATAIVLDANKDYLFEARLSRIMKDEGLASFEALVGRLSSPGASPLRQRVVEAMTTNETSFFRDVQPFEALRRTILPQILADRAQDPKAPRSLAIWSAACSTGQELYSIAMMLREQKERFAGWTLQLLGTDIASDVLARARAGRFSQLEVNRGLPAPALVRHFDKAGLEWTVKEELRRMAEFRSMNLIEAWPQLPRFDVVMLRNVLIYFDVPTKRRILERIAQVMRPGGVLFLGAVETTLNLTARFAEVQCDRAICHRVLPQGD